MPGINAAAHSARNDSVSQPHTFWDLTHQWYVIKMGNARNQQCRQPLSQKSGLVEIHDESLEDVTD